MRTRHIYYLCAFFALSSVFGQMSLATRELLKDPRFVFNPKEPFVVSDVPVKAPYGSIFLNKNSVIKLKDINHQSVENLSFDWKLFGNDMPPLDMRTVSFVWHPDDNETVRLRSSKLSYRYEPKEFPKSFPVFIDDAILKPIRGLIIKCLDF